MILIIINFHIPLDRMISCELKRNLISHFIFWILMWKLVVIKLNFYVRIGKFVMLIKDE